MGKGRNGSGTNQTNGVDRIGTSPNGTKAPLSSNGKEKAGGDKSAEEDAPRTSCFHRYSFMVVLLANAMVDGLGMAVSGLFRYQFFRRQHHDQLDAINGTNGGTCSTGELATEVQDIENSISKETAQWGLYHDYVMIVPLFVSSLLIGMKSDQIGRRFLFVLPFFNSIVMYGIMAVVIKLELHYGWTLVGTFVSSCSGGSIGMYFASYALLSDTHGKKHSTKANANPTSKNPTVQDSEKTEKKDSPEDAAPGSQDNDLDMSREKSRTLKIVALDVARRVFSSIISFATGYVIEYAGFFYVLVMVLACKGVLLAMAHCFVRETGEQKKSTGFLVPLGIIKRAFQDPAKRNTLILVNLALFFTIFGFCDEMEVSRTYEMSPPFCLDAIKLGWLRSESRLKGLFSLPLMALWNRLRLGESTIAAIGTIFLSGSAFVLASVREMWVFFAQPAFSIPGTLSTAMGKAISSRLIGRSALASTFAVILAGEEVFMFMGSVSSSYMYQHFVSTIPTASFYMAACAFFIAAFLFAVESLRRRRDSNEPLRVDIERSISFPHSETAKDATAATD